MAISIERTYQRYRESDAGDFLLIFGSLIFLLALGLYGFFFFLTLNLEQEIKSLQSQLSLAITPADAEAENKVFIYKNKIKDLKQLLNQHSFPLKILDILEASLYPPVQILRISYSKRELALNVEGITESLEVLAYQQKAFEEIGQVKEVLTTKASLTKGGKVRFSMLIRFKESIFENNI